MTKGYGTGYLEAEAIMTAKSVLALDPWSPVELRELLERMSDDQRRHLADVAELLRDQAASDQAGTHCVWAEVTPNHWQVVTRRLSHAEALQAATWIGFTTRVEEVEE